MTSQVVFGGLARYLAPSHRRISRASSLLFLSRSKFAMMPSPDTLAAPTSGPAR